MYSKLLKHDWRATRGMLGILCIICLGAALAGGATMRYLVWSSNTAQSDLLVVANVLAMIACIFTILLCGAAGVLLYIWRFYKSRYTDEGFLTFTLPVTTHQNLLSAMLNTAIGTVLLWLCIGVSGMVFLMIGMSGIEGFYSALWQELPQLLSEIFRSEEVKYLWVMLLNILTGSLAELVILMLSVTIGAVIAKKHKILAALGSYYGIHLVLSFLTSATFFSTVLYVTTDPGAMARIFSLNSAVMLVVAVGGYFLMHYLADRKLNLT